MRAGAQAGARVLGSRPHLGCGTAAGSEMWQPGWRSWVQGQIWDGFRVQGWTPDAGPSLWSWVQNPCRVSVPRLLILGSRLLRVVKSLMPDPGGGLEFKKGNGMLG